MHTMESSAQSTKQGGFKKQKRAPIPDANENVVTLLHTGAANKRIKTSESSDFNFFLQLPTCVFEYLCEWLNGDDILRLVHCGRRDTSARIYAHADKLVFGGKCRPWSVLQFVRELLPFAAHLRHLEIDVACWPEKGTYHGCPKLSFAKLEHLGFPNGSHYASSRCFALNLVNPLPKTMKTLDLSGCNWFSFSLDCDLFSLFSHLSNLESLLLPQMGTWRNFAIPSIPSSVTNLNLIANVNPDDFRGIFGANFDSCIFYHRPLASLPFDNNLVNPATIEQLSCTISDEMVHYFNGHSEKMVLSRLNCLTRMAAGFQRQSDPKLKMLPSSLKELFIINEYDLREGYSAVDFFFILPPGLQKFSLTHHLVNFHGDIRDLLDDCNLLGGLPRSLVELRLDLGVQFRQFEDFERLPTTLTDLSLVICENSRVDPEWAASVPLDAVFLPQLRRLSLFTACDHVNASFLVHHWMSPTLQSLALQGEIFRISNFEIPGLNIQCYSNTSLAVQHVPTLYDRPLLTELAIRTDGIVYDRIRQFLPPSLTHFTYTTDLNQSECIPSVNLDAGRVFPFLPPTLLYLGLGFVRKNTVDREKLPEAIRKNPFFKFVCRTGK